MSLRRRAALALAAALAACGDGTGRDPGGGPTVMIGGVSFHLSSGGSLRRGGGLTLYVTDQVDTCSAIGAIPRGTVVTFQLAVAPRGDGTLAAAVVAGKSAPGPGEAVGGLSVATGGTVTATREASDGSVAWTADGTGAVTIATLDVGFAGTADRLQASGLRLASCP